MLDKSSDYRDAISTISVYLPMIAASTKKAEKYQRDALRIRQTSLGDDSPETWQSLNNLAIVLAQRRKVL